MSAFQLDTSGSVELPLRTEDGDRPARHFWSDLSPFEQGYVEALFESLPSEECDGCPGDRPDDALDLGLECCRPSSAFSDLSPEALALILKDCASFLADPRCGSEPLGAENGKAFWALRQMSAGTEHGFPPLAVSLGDDGKVRLTETPSKRASS